MPGTRESFIEAAASSLPKDTEQGLGARRWIGEMIEDADEAVLAESVLRWEKVDSLKRPGRWRRIAMVAMLAVSLGAVMPFVSMVRDARNLVWLTTGGWEAFMDPPRLDVSRLRPAEIVLVGDPEQTQLQQAEALRASNPSEPAFFAEYAVAYHREFKRLPPHYFEIANRLDPDNAWFDCFAAGCVADNAVRRESLTLAQRAAKNLREWSVLKEKEFTEGLALFRASHKKKRFDNYATFMMRKRIPLLPQGRQSEFFTSINHLSSSLGGHSASLSLGKLIAARAWQLAESDNVEEFRVLQLEALDFIDKVLAAEVSTLFGELVHRGSLSVVVRDMHKAAVALGVDDERPEWAIKVERLDLLEAQRKARRKLPIKEPDVFEKHGGKITSSIYSFTEGLVAHPPLVTEADLKPGRLGEHDFAAMVSMIATWLLLSLGLLLVFLYRFRAPMTVRKISDRVETLVHPRDWVWIMIGGAITPVLIAIGLSVFTSVGGRNMPVKLAQIGDFDFWLPPLPWMALFLLLLIVPALLSGWRLAVSARAFRFPGKSWTGWFAVLGLLVAVAGQATFHVYAVFGLLGFAVLWLVVEASRAMFSGSDRLLPRAIISRLLIPAYAAGMTGMVAAAFAFQASHQYWFERDDFMRLTPEFPAMTPYEYKLAKQMRVELRELMDVQSMPAPE